jgi:hypothetical protein
MLNKFIPFGDSHSLFWGNNNDFSSPISLVNDVPKICWLGPAKIHGFTNPSENQTSQKLEEVRTVLDSMPDAVPIACFGEIDIRVNLYTQVVSSKNFSSIEEIVLKYLSYLNTLKSNTIIIWGPPPQKIDSPSYLKNSNFSYPIVGCTKTRNSITHIFNTLIIKNLSHYPKIRFVTMFYDFVDCNLNTIPSALGDSLHYSLDHYGYAKKLLTHALEPNCKAVFNIDKFKNIADIQFRIEPANNYLDCIDLRCGTYSSRNFEYFCWGAFDTKIENKSRIFLGVDGDIYKLNTTTLTPIDYLNLYFDGTDRSDISDLVDFTYPLVTFEHDHMDSHIKKNILKQIQRTDVIKIINTIAASLCGQNQPILFYNALFDEFADYFQSIGAFDKSYYSS